MRTTIGVACVRNFTPAERTFVEKYVDGSSTRVLATQKGAAGPEPWGETAAPACLRKAGLEVCRGTDLISDQPPDSLLQDVTKRCLDACSSRSLRVVTGPRASRLQGNWRLGRLKGTTSGHTSSKANISRMSSPFVRFGNGQSLRERTFNHRSCAHVQNRQRRLRNDAPC